MNAQTEMWTLKLSGQVTLRDSVGLEIVLPSKFQYLLLALLCQNPGYLKDRVVISGILWPGCSIKAARDSLRNAFAILKAKLPEHSLIATKDSIGLAAGFVNLGTPDSKTDVFMPGYDHEWAIDMRLELRDQACNTLLVEAERAFDSADIIQAQSLISQVLSLDELNETAHRLKVTWLNDSGKTGEAIRAMDQFRRRSVRELGIVPDLVQTDPSTDLIDHPLFSSARWLLQWNPDHALSLLASTRADWATLPVEPALAIHESVLNKALARGKVAEVESEILLVEAQYYYLLVLAGRLDGKIEAAKLSFLKAEQIGEFESAARLGFALAYGLLSRGDFQGSIRFARAGIRSAKKTGDSSLVLESTSHLATILPHVGSIEAGAALMMKCAAESNDVDSPLLYAGVQLGTIDILLREGKTEQALATFDRVRRIFMSCGANRMQAWMYFQDSMFHLHMGDRIRAFEGFEKIRALGPAFAGHSVTAATEDWLAVLNYEMGELKDSALAMGRAASFRRSLKTVASIKERPAIQRTLKQLEEKLDIVTLRNAYRQGKDFVARLDR